MLKSASDDLEVLSKRSMLGTLREAMKGIYGCEQWKGT